MMRDSDLEMLTLKELFYIKDELNELYADLKSRCSEWEDMHAMVSEEFKTRKVEIDISLNQAERDRKRSYQIDKAVNYKYAAEYDEKVKNTLH